MANPIATNKKAFRDYFLEEKWECGIELKGGEVKSVRAGEVNFKDSFALPEGEEVFLYNLHISPYAQAGVWEEDSDRRRKLLLHKREIKKILGKTTQKGLTLIPTRIYFNNHGFVKVEIALARGKRLYDKRETVKKRDVQRDLKRVLRQGRR